ncbi:unnamed protein product [Cuscuta campestris]|uniref:F-box domain-containing protein n=1 Tax=Cuscuta campestris TaxID=132261 RepID=A0A484N2Q1_9ASTE|nr:unnamed protein product [Cuscuta campestris]
MSSSNYNAVSSQAASESTPAIPLMMSSMGTTFAPITTVGSIGMIPIMSTPTPTPTTTMFPGSITTPGGAFTPYPSAWAQFAADPANAQALQGYQQVMAMMQQAGGFMPFAYPGMTPPIMPPPVLTPTVTKQMRFVVVDIKCVHNAILGRPGINQVRAIISMAHLCMKFYTPNGIGEERGDQKNARSCYLEAVKKMTRQFEQIELISQQVDKGEEKARIEPDANTEEIQIDASNPERKVKIGADLQEELRTEIVQVLTSKVKDGKLEQVIDETADVEIPLEFMMLDTTMPSSTTTAAATTADHGEGTTISALHPEIIRTHLLTRLDGPTLASAGAAFTELHALCSEENLWRRLCHSSWPSTADPIARHAISAFPSGHRSFFSDSFPTIHHRGDSLPSHRPPATELISAVDIFYGEKSIYSKAVVSETVSNWFSSSPFRLELPNTKGTPRTFPCAAGQEKLTLSWILIDPSEKRSVNVSSLKPVGFRQNCFTGDIEIRFATVLEGGGGDWVQFSVVVTCEGKEGGEAHVREASMQVEDMEGKSVNGKESLVTRIKMNLEPILDGDEDKEMCVEAIEYLNCYLSFKYSLLLWA